jgi:hypothetical protein
MAGKDWYTKFEHDKWKADPGLALCCAATRGVWIEMIGSMMQLGSGKLSGTLAEHARLARLSEADIEAALIELHKFNVAEVHRHARSGAERDTERDIERDKSVTVTVVSRYLSRLFDKKENATTQARLRQRKHRSRSCHAVGHAHVTRHTNSNSNSNTEYPLIPLAADGPAEMSRFTEFCNAYAHNKRHTMNKALLFWVKEKLDDIAPQVFAALDECKRDPNWEKRFAPAIHAWLEGRPWVKSTKPLESIRDARESDALMVRQLPSDAVERIVEALKAKHAKFANWPKSQFVNTPPPEFVAMVKEGHHAA